MKKMGFWGAAAAVLLIFLAIEWRASQKEPAPAFAQAAVTNSVRADLMKIARAQQYFMADHNRYGTVEELTAAGALAMKTPGRGVYQYTVEATETGFVVTARAKGEEESRWPVLTINERMEIAVEPATGVK